MAVQPSPHKCSLLMIKNKGCPAFKPLVYFSSSKLPFKNQSKIQSKNQSRNQSKFAFFIVFLIFSFQSRNQSWNFLKTTILLKKNGFQSQIEFVQKSIVRLNFFNRGAFGKSFSNTSTINNHTRTAIIALREILAHCLPKTVPLHPEHRQTTIVYTDAFFSDGNKQFRNSDFSHEEARPDFNYDHTNGWAAVIFPPGKKPTIVHGSVPRKILQHFASNKAYIYFLEAWAAIITPVLIQPLLTNPYVQLCDNDPATHAINKGSGRHQPLNNLIGSHWAWHNRHQLTQILKRVPSKANIADPFSRRDFTIAESLGWNIFQALGWNIFQAPTEHLIPTVHKIVGNATFAHQQGLSRNDAIHQFRRNL